MPLPANVELGRAQLSARELNNLAIGDVIKLDQPTGDPLRLNIGDRMIGSAYVGAHRGRLVAGVKTIVQIQPPTSDKKSVPPPPVPAPGNPAPAAARPPPARPPERPQPDKTKGHPS